MFLSIRWLYNSNDIYWLGIFLLLLLLLSPSFFIVGCCLARSVSHWKKGKLIVMFLLSFSPFYFPFLPFWFYGSFLDWNFFFSFLSDTPIEKHVTLACLPADLLARLSTSDSFSLKNFAKDACMCRCAYVHRVETERWKEKMKTSLATLSCMLIFALFTSYSGEYRRCNHDCCLHTHGPTCKKKGVAHCICSTPRKEIEKMTAASTTT